MKLLWATIFLFSIFCSPAVAQSDWRVFGGFSYVRAATSPQLEPLGLEHMNMYGWGASLTNYTSLKWLGVTAEVSGQYAHPSFTIPADYIEPGVPEMDTEFTDMIFSSTYAAMIGPSFAYRGNSGIEPFAHFLVGGIYGKESLTSKGEIEAGFAMSTSDWVFGYALGGGADIKLSKIVALRGQVDWIRSTFPDMNKDRQNNMRVLAGIVLRFSE